MTEERQAVSRVLLPLEDAADENYLRLTAAVLANWFNAPLQIVTPSGSDVEHWSEVAAGTGVDTLPVVVLSDPAAGQEWSFVEQLAAHARVNGPAVCVVPDVVMGTALIEHADQPVLIPGQRREAHRIASGPLIVPMTGHFSDLDSLAVAASWARQLHLGIRLVAASDCVDDVPNDHERRLRLMGLEAGVDRLTSSVVDSTLNVAISRKAAAIVIPQGSSDGDELIERATQIGVSVLLAPSFDHRSIEEVFTIDFSDSGTSHGSDVAPGVFPMTREECHTQISSNSVARIAYVDHGWPVALPVNYSTSGSDVIIRSVPGGKLAAAERGDVVCLEIDGFDDDDRSGWSVLVHGHLEVIADAASLRAAWASDPNPWVAGTHFEWLKLTPLSMTGRRLAPADDLVVFGHGPSDVTQP